MDPVSAIAGAVDSAYQFAGKVVDFFTIGQRAKYERLPDWLSPKDFQTKDNTSDIILIGMFVVLLAVIIAIIFSARRGAK